MNKFNLKSFPFDKQVLSFKIVDNLWGIDKRIIEPRGYTDIVLKEYSFNSPLAPWAVQDKLPKPSVVSCCPSLPSTAGKT